MKSIKKFMGKRTEDDVLIEQYKQLLKQHPDREMPDIHLKLGNSYENIGEKEAAIEEYAIAATLYFQAREIYGACACNYLITHLDPSNRDALANLALIQFQAGTQVSQDDSALFLQNLGITLNKQLSDRECQQERSQPKPQSSLTGSDMKNASVEKPRTRLALSKMTRERQQETHFQMERKSLVDLIEGNTATEEQKQNENNPSDSNVLIDLRQNQPLQASEVLELNASPPLAVTQKKSAVCQKVSSVSTEIKNGNLRQTIPLFSELSQAEWDRMIQKATISSHAKNMCIMQGRNDQQKFFVILDGTVDLHIEFYEDEQRTLTIPLKKGEFWGEHSFLRQKGVSLIALATTPCTILELPKTSLISLAQRYSGILETLKNTCKRRCFYPTISKNSIFAHLTTQERQDIAEYFFTMKVEKGTDIITEGTHDRGIYLIKSGEVEVRTALVEQEDSHIISTDQKQICLATLTAGDIFGEGSFFTKEPRSATISALTDTELLKLPAQSLIQVLRDYPHIEALLQDIHQQRAINTVTILQDIL